MLESKAGREGAGREKMRFRSFSRGERDEDA